MAHDTLWRVCTESVLLHEAMIREIACHLFGGCTLIHGDGAWQGANQVYTEPSLIIEFTGMHDPATVARVKQLAVYVCSLLAQEAVLIYSLPVHDSEFVAVPR